VHQIRSCFRLGGGCHVDFQRTLRREVGHQSHGTHQGRPLQGRQKIQDVLHRMRQGEADQGQLGQAHAQYYGKRDGQSHD